MTGSDDDRQRQQLLDITINPRIIQFVNLFIVFIYLSLLLYILLFLTPISSDNLRTSAKNLISSKSGIPAIVTDSEYGTEKNDKRLWFRPEYKVPTPFRCRKEHYNVPMV